MSEECRKGSLVVRTEFVSIVCSFDRLLVEEKKV